MNIHCIGERRVFIAAIQVLRTNRHLVCDCDEITWQDIEAGHVDVETLIEQALAIVDMVLGGTFEPDASAPDADVPPWEQRREAETQSRKKVRKSK